MSSPLKILFITPSYKPAFVYGGPTVSVSQLAEALVEQGAEVAIYTTTANGKEELKVETGVPLLINGVSVYYFKRITGDHTHVSPALWLKLFRSIREYDVVHIQSWWSVLVFGAAAICVIKTKPFVLAPRGMLSQYSFQHLNTGAKKWLHRLIGKRLLRRSYLHATTVLEWEDCRYINPNWKGFVLPNLIQFPDDKFVKHTTLPSDVLTIGFLSRVDPKKGLEVLFRALADVCFPFRLLIAGEGEDNYLHSLKELAATLHLADKIAWCGWKGGDEKYAFLQSIDLFALISHNENFANVVIEALAVGTAALLSDRVGLADYVSEKNLGWVSPREHQPLVSVLNTIYQERERLRLIAAEAPAIVRHDFKHDRSAQSYLSAYQAIYKLKTINTSPGGKPMATAIDAA